MIVLSPAIDIAGNFVVIRMLADLHLPLLCQISKSAPSFLWSVGNFMNGHPLPIGRSNPALMIAKASVLSLLDSRPRCPERWVTSAMMRTPVAQQRK